MASTSAALRRRRRAERMFKRAVRRIRRFFASYVSPLGWAVTGAGIACLIAFPFLGWYELLVFGIVAMVMMLAAIVLSLGNTRFHASIVVSNHRVTVGDTVSVIVGIDNTGRTPTTTARGYLPIGDAHERFNIPMLAPGQSKQTDVEFRTVSRAILPIGPLRIRKGDPFGLVRHEKELADRIGPVDALVTAEAKGIALAYEVSRQMGLKEFIVIRKSVKAYMKDVVETTVNSITTTEMQRLYLDGVEADKIRGKNICLLDDVISTGESKRAMETLVQQACANEVARAAVLAEGEAADRKDIIFLKKLPLFHVDEQGHHTELA